MNRKPTSPLHPLVEHLIYGDIGEMPLNILGEECPSQEDYQRLGVEEDTRLQAAATVQAWLNDCLHKNGYIHDPERHEPSDLIPSWKKEAVQVVSEEPELPGEMPEEMWETIRNDRDAVTQALKIAVRETKAGIIKRILG